MLYEVHSLSQQERIDYAKAILDQSKAQGDKVMESVALAELGYLLAFNGDLLQGAEIIYSALDMAEHHGNEQALSIIHLDLSHCMQDRPSAIAHLHTALELAERAKDDYCVAWCHSNLIQHHRAMGVRDSALFHAQRCYDLCLSKNIEAILPYALTGLAVVHSKLYDERSIGYEYLKKAGATRFGKDNPEAYLMVYNILARFHLEDARADSALFYADRMRTKLAYGAPFHALRAYELYKDIYANTNSDSALKYHRLFDQMRDSIQTMERSQQLSLLLMKKDIELDQEAESRARNLQFAFIAVGIIVFVIVFLLLSRSIITNTRVISFLGVMALLIVFEFLNLLLHPWLEKVTHHSPPLMLLALVCIAALLVPLHHKLEKWATEKLVEKNKAIRLAEAKKTIEQLEKPSS